MAAEPPAPRSPVQDVRSIAVLARDCFSGVASIHNPVFVSDGRFLPDAQPVAPLAMADVAMKDQADAGEPAQKRARVNGTRVVWCVEHKDNEIWKQFPEDLAKMVEQAHMHTTKHTHAHAHKQTHVKRGLPVVVDGGG